MFVFLWDTGQKLESLMVPGSDVRGTAGPSSKAIPFIMYTKDALRQELFWWQELENAFVCTLTSISLWSLNVASSSHCFIYTFFSSLDEDENTQPGCKYLSRTVLLSLCFPVLLKTCNVTLVWPSWFAFKAAVRGREKKVGAVLNSRGRRRGYLSLAPLSGGVRITGENVQT